jgi:hypothetical protein
MSKENSTKYGNSADQRDLSRVHLSLVRNINQPDLYRQWAKYHDEKGGYDKRNCRTNIERL